MFGAAIATLLELLACLAAHLSANAKALPAYRGQMVQFTNRSRLYAQSSRDYCLPDLVTKPTYRQAGRKGRNGLYHPADVDKLLEYILSNARNPAAWMTTRGRLVASLVPAGLAWVVAERLPIKGWAIPLISIGAAVVGVLACMAGCWWYLRSGRGVRVGVCLDGIGIDSAELSRTQEEFDTLAANKKLREHIVLKRLPRSFVSTPESQARTLRRFGLSMTVWLEVSATSRPNGKHYSIVYNMMTREKIERDVQEAASLHSGAIFALGTLSNVLSDALRQRAQGLMESILFQVAIARMTDKAFDEAARAFMEVDDRLSGRQAPDQNPRLAARSYAVWCLMASSSYSVSDLPGPDAMSKAVQNGALAVSRYQTQFPYAVPLQARNLFFAGRLEEAMAVLQTVDLNKLIGEEYSATAIDLAVLHLFSGHWSESAKYFDLFEKTGKFKDIAAELVAFADYCAELGYSAAPFIQGLYRRWRDRAVTEQDKDDAALKWLRADSSRRTLDRVYRAAIPKRKRSQRP